MSSSRVEHQVLDVTHRLSAGLAVGLEHEHRTLWHIAGDNSDVVSWIAERHLGDRFRRHGDVGGTFVHDGRFTGRSDEALPASTAPSGAWSVSTQNTSPAVSTLVTPDSGTASPIHLDFVGDEERFPLFTHHRLLGVWAVGAEHEICAVGHMPFERLADVADR